MGRKTFESLVIWQNAQELAIELSLIFYNKRFNNFSFQDQIMRAAISVSNNIAEGYGRGTAKDFVRFLYISKGSCEEVKSMIYLARSLNYIDENQTESFIQKCTTLSVKLNNFITYVRNKKSK